MIFYQYRDEFHLLTDRLRRKKEERERNVIGSNGSDDFNKRNEQLIKRRELIERVYEAGELERRLSNATYDIWYLSVIAGLDATKYHSARQVRLRDAIYAIDFYSRS